MYIFARISRYNLISFESTILCDIKSSYTIDYKNIDKHLQCSYISGYFVESILLFNIYFISSNLKILIYKIPMEKLSEVKRFHLDISRYLKV